MKTTLSLPHVALASLLALSVVPLSRAFSWSASQLDGAGTQNCIAIQPGGTGVILSASDVSGLQRSANYGASWQGVNIGVPASGPGKAAVVCWSNSSTHANTAYAGDDDGFLSSTDGGQTWSLLSGTPNFNGQGTWPRAVGNLIACDQSSSFPGYLYCGSGSSILRSSDGGSTWTTIFTDGAGDLISGLALNPSTPTTLYIATQGDGTYSTVNARTVGTGGWTHLATVPSRPEELLVLTDGSLYAAGSDASAGGGVWKWNGSSFSSLGAPAASGTSYLGISGYGTGSSATIYASATSPATDGTARASVIKTTNSGSSWSNITQSANVVNQIGGPGGPAWWQILSGVSAYGLGNTQGDMESIEVDPSNHNIVFTSGRAGIWQTTNATAAAGSILWYPYVSGLSVCVAEWSATDPNHAGRVYITDEDWTFFYSTDGGNTFRRNASGMSTGTTGRPIFVDPQNSTVYCGQLQDDSTLVGDIYSNADPTTGAAWTSTGFNSGPSVGAKPRGVAAGRDSSGHVALVAVSDKSKTNAAGLWYSDNGGAWSQISTAITPNGAGVVPIVWNANSKYVFIYAQGSGLWRSNNYGVSGSWANIWGTTSPAIGEGFLAEDPNQEGRLYVSTASGVYRFDDARTGSAPTATAMGGPANPGAMTLANGILYCCDRYVTVGTNSSMYRWLAPAMSTTNAVISNGAYSGQSQWPSGLAADANGTIYVSERDEGCMVGSPVLFADTFSSASNWTPDGGTWGLVTLGGASAYQGSNATSSALAYVNVSGSASWQSYSMSADVTPVSFTAGSCGISLYFADANDRYMVQITPAGAVNIKSDVGGTQTTLASGTYTYTSGATYTLRLVANNVAGTLTAYLGATQVAQATGVTFSPSSGTAALNVFDGTADFQNVLIDQL